MAASKYERSPNEPITFGAINSFFLQGHRIHLGDVTGRFADRETYGRVVLDYVIGYPPLDALNQQPDMIALPTGTMQQRLALFYQARIRDGAAFRERRQDLLRSARGHLAQVPFLRVADDTRLALEAGHHEASVMAEDVLAIGAQALRALQHNQQALSPELTVITNPLIEAQPPGAEQKSA